MKKVLFLAFACLLMVLTACSSKTKEFQEKIDEVVALSKEYKAAKDANNEAKMQELVKKGSDLKKEMEEITKDMSEDELKEFSEEIEKANKSKMDYDVVFFQAAVEAYDDHTTILSFEKRGNDIIYNFENDPNTVHHISLK